VPDSIYDLLVFPVNTSIFFGDVVSIKTVDNLHRSLNYKWSLNDEPINCSVCTSIIVKPFESEIYKLNVTDTISCYFPKEIFVTINIKEGYIIFVPDAFTPGIDGKNGEIKVDGYGFRFIEFRIFNRWGTEVFFTNNMDDGWDGFYKNKLQSMDSYAYIVKVELGNNEIIEKKGTFSLLR
jgi:gliding motility-associated-like protein